MSAAKSSAKRSPEVTPWFPADVKPVREGIYQSREGHQMKWYWDGTKWKSPSNTWTCTFQLRQWRGLASDPSKVDK